MCGITGFWQLESLTSDFKLDESIKKMANTLSHRGPDDFGIWIDYNLKIALGHRRLSILDVSKAGHQPMVSKNGNYVITFNGEIYNHLTLRSELNNFLLNSGKLAVIWSGNSDTETKLSSPIIFLVKNYCCKNGTLLGNFLFYHLVTLFSYKTSLPK